MNLELARFFQYFTVCWNFGTSCIPLPEYLPEINEDNVYYGIGVMCFTDQYTIGIAGCLCCLWWPFAPVDGLPSLGAAQVEPDPITDQETGVLKLNGGLGTSMGWRRPRVFSVSRGRLHTAQSCLY